MKKIFILLAMLFLFGGVLAGVSACHVKKSLPKTQAQKVFDESVEILPTMNTESSAQNQIWVGTFQIVWNNLIDNFLYSPVEFEGVNVKMAQDLNAREFNKSDISDDSYYSNYGIISPKLKKEIEKGIKDKFNEKSDILDSIDFTYNPGMMLFYAMLKKDFKFLEPFDKLSDSKFLNSTKTFKFFGINADSSSKLYQNVSVLFYNNSDDYAVKLSTKSNDEVILYRTDDNSKFNEYFTQIKQKSEKYKESNYFGHNDRLKVPDISLYYVTNFKDLEGKKIKGKNFKIDATIETVDFKMNNEGVKLKSEAAIIMKATALPTPVKIRYFYFDKPFVLFLIEKDKSVPYFGMKVKNLETLNNR